MGDGAAPSRTATLRAAQEHLGLTLIQVWIAYISVGGDAPLRVVRGWLVGLSEPSDREHDFMAQSLNDYFVERGLDHPVPYAEAMAS
jgi:hypothetical protein